MELTERITSRVAELPARSKHCASSSPTPSTSWTGLVIAGQVITQLLAGDAAAADPGAGPPAGTGPAQRGFGLLVSPRGQASGTGDLPAEYRSLLEAVAAVSPVSSESPYRACSVSGRCARRVRGGPGRRLA